MYAKLSAKLDLVYCLMQSIYNDQSYLKAINLFIVMLLEI